MCGLPLAARPTAHGAVSGLESPAPLFGGLENERSIEELFWVTKHGLRMTGMPAWGPTQEDEEFRALVALIEAFPRFGPGEYDDLPAAARERGIDHDHANDHD